MKYLLTIIAVSFLLSIPAMPQASDAMLKSVFEKDRTSRDAAGKLITLTAAEHISRGQTYYDNRQFPQAREHFQKVFDNYATDPLMSSALFLTGRSYYWERAYARAIPYLDRVAREYPATKDGREGLYFDGACNVRIGKNAEAAAIYEQYTVMYSTGERIDGAYLNMIDALREAGKYDEANSWVDKTIQRFSGMPTEANALHARLRMNIYRAQWAEAVSTADTMLARAKFTGAMTSADEVKYLKAFALDKAGKRGEALSVYSSIPDNSSSYYSGLAAERLASAGSRVKQTTLITPKLTQDFPAAFRSDVIRESKKRNIDPRFVLAIMKQESTFRPTIKSPSAARGLLQLVFDTALKYNKKAGYPALQPDDLYQPGINIAIGCEYIADLKNQFGGLYEAIAASYNGGEDNAARWLDRSKPRDPGIFSSEVGFAETKSYVFKVMTNYRIYRDLYDENLNNK
ncbi:MAG TPA: transglycosylase SLT domain-containing protein [Pyrinomonadaceae bacterium]|nr:transglycosylase SLT domain-containing protein [Pyrinomonadaceae bacterium]